MIIILDGFGETSVKRIIKTIISQHFLFNGKFCYLNFHININVFLKIVMYQNKLTTAILVTDFPVLITEIEWHNLATQA